MAEMNFFEKIFVNSFIFDLFLKLILLPSFFRFTGNVSGKILEIGCGKGTTTFGIVKRYSKADLTAIDYDEEQVKKAVKIFPLRYISRTSFEQGDATNLRFKDKSFDFVFELNSFHHIKNYEKAIKEVYRVLKKDGKFLIMDIWFPLILHGESVISKKSFENKLINNDFEVEKSKGLLGYYITARKA